MHRALAAASLIPVLLVVCSCQSSSADDATRATAVIEGRSGRPLRGFAEFTELPEGVRVSLDIQGATPGEHGVFISDYGDCHLENASSAGGHFNPDRGPHGAPDDVVRHAGDMGNIKVDANGNGRLDWLLTGVSVHTSSRSIAYRAIVITERRDDLKSQPAGDSGVRIGCGEILPSDS